MRYSRITGLVLIIIASILLLSDFDETSTLTYYIVLTLIVKILGITVGYIGVQLITKRTQS